MLRCQNVAGATARPLDYKLVMVLTGTPVESFFLLEPGTLNSAHRQQIEQWRRRF